MVRRSVIIKVVAGLAAMGTLGVLFVRSAQNVRSEPYEVARDRLARWTLTIERASSSSGAVLALRPQRELAAGLFNQVFSRSGESMNGPVPAEMPLVLQGEFDRAMAGTLTPEALLALARVTGLESAALEPTCMAHRRISAPGMVRQVYFLKFALPAFDEFRRQVARQLRDAGRSGSLFEPAALSPILIVAASDAAFSRWLPLQSDGSDDCLAPIAAH